MSINWKPGDIAVSTRWGYRSIFVAACPNHSRRDGMGCWHNESGYSDSEDSPRRPLVVIDPEDREQVERLTAFVVDLLHAWPKPKGVGPDAMQAALREFANPTPPKPDEPTGLGAVVEDEGGDRWVKFADSEADGRNWAGGNGDHNRNWSEINVVEVLSEGVSS